jgi:hypothetical protein
MAIGVKKMTNRFAQSYLMKKVWLSTVLCLCLAGFASAQVVDAEADTPTVETVETLGDAATVEVPDDAATRKNSDLWSDLIPVLAAFGGAALTFLATQLTDKKNWARAQRDGLRNRQFEKISNAARALSVATDSFSSIDTSVAEFNGGEQRSEMVHEATILRFAAKAKNWKVEINAAQHQLRYAEIELELVGVPKEILSSLAAAIEGVERLSDQLDCEGQAPDQFPVESIGQTLDSIRESSSSFVTAARSFHGAHYG